MTVGEEDAAGEDETALFSFSSPRAVLLPLFGLAAAESGEMVHEFNCNFCSTVCSSLLGNAMTPSIFAAGFVMSCEVRKLAPTLSTREVGCSNHWSTSLGSKA